MGLALVLGLLVPVAGLGLLYLLRGAGVADIGPRPSGALPLEQLAGADAQPLARMALAWLPVGLVTGALIATFARSAAAAALGIVTLVAGALLVLSGGVSVAVENGESLTQHLTAPLAFGGTWVSLGLFVMGAVVAERLAARGSRAPSAG